MALPPKTASTTAMIVISQDEIFVMLIPPLQFVNEVKLFNRCQRGARDVLV
jgi:hypothetical protein